LDPASPENDLLSLCVVHLQIVAGRPSLYVFNLHIARVPELIAGTTK